MAPSDHGARSPVSGGKGEPMDTTGDGARGEMRGGASGYLERRFVSFEATVEDFHDPRQEWRRLVSELLGTFFLVLVAVGAGMVNARFGGNAVPFTCLLYTSPSPRD